VHPICEVIFGAISNCSFFHEIFAFGPYLVITLLTLRLQKLSILNISFIGLVGWFIASFLFRSSSAYCDSNSYRSFSLNALAKSTRAITIEIIKKMSIELMPKIKQRRLRAMTLQGAINKIILLSQY